MLLTGFALSMLMLAGWLALREEPREMVGRLPLGANENIPPIFLIVAAGAVAAAFFIGLAALNMAAAIQVLARDSRIPAPLPPEVRRLRSLVLAPMGRQTNQLVREPDLPPTKLPSLKTVGSSIETSLRLTVLIPAHDEALTLPATLSSLRDQSRLPDSVVVVADNCTDDTAAIARQHEAEVFTTINNVNKKAGALNQALSRRFDHIDNRDVIMVLDADSIIAPDFVKTALDRMESDPDLMPWAASSMESEVLDWWVNCNAMSTVATRDTSPVDAEKCLSLPALRPCSASMHSRPLQMLAAPSFLAIPVTFTTRWP